MVGEPHNILDLAMGQMFRLRGVLDPTLAVPGLGASVSEALALSHLISGEMTQQDLGEHLGLEKSTISRLVDAMVGKGWADKQPDPGNRRYRRVRLTPTGRRVAAEVVDAMGNRHARILAALTPEERHAVAVGLSALLRAWSHEFGTRHEADRA